MEDLQSDYSQFFVLLHVYWLVVKGQAGGFSDDSFSVSMNVFVDSDRAGGRASSCRLVHGTRRFWDWTRDNGDVIYGAETRWTFAGSSPRPGQPHLQDDADRTAALLSRATRSDPRQVGQHDEASGGGASHPPLPDSRETVKIRLFFFFFLTQLSVCR